MSRHLFPSIDEGLDLHHRLLGTDPHVTKEMCERYARPLSEFLRNRDPRADEHACVSAANDALLEYLRAPQKFDPTRLDLAAYLRMAAACNLSNSRRAESKHFRGREPAFRVEDAIVGGNHAGDDPAVSLVRREEQATAQCRIEAVRAECDESERVVLEALLDGERSTSRIAAVIGLEQLPDQEQRQVVKRFKDRVKKRIERGGSNGGPPG